MHHCAELDEAHIEHEGLAYLEGHCRVVSTIHQQRDEPKQLSDYIDNRLWHIWWLHPDPPAIYHQSDETQCVTTQMSVLQETDRLMIAAGELHSQHLDVGATSVDHAVIVRGAIHLQGVYVMLPTMSAVQT